MNQKKRFNLAVLISLICFCGTLLITAVARFSRPQAQTISLTDNFHVSAWVGSGGEILGFLAFFNNAKYGPYHGSIMNLGGENDKVTSSGWSIGNYDFGETTSIDPNGNLSRKRFCTLPGIYFRHFQIHEQARPLWTLIVSLWYPLSLFGVLPVIGIFRQLSSRHRQSSTV